MKRILRKLWRNRNLQQRHEHLENPFFERLERRLLLNADVQGLLADNSLDTDLPTEVIEVDLNMTLEATTYTAQTLPYTQDFSSGLPGATAGWEYYSDNDGRIQVVGGALRMDDSVSGGTYSLNEAILHLDLTGQANVTLILDHTNIGDEYHSIPNSFTDHYKGDGIALSVDGVNWVKITILDSSFTAKSFSLDAIIELAKTAAGSTDVSNVRIKFQQYDNYPAYSDGRELIRDGSITRTIMGESRL